MKILVTGAAGFIGAAVTEKLLQNGNFVTAIDSFTDYYSQSLKKKRAERLSDNYNLEIQHIELSQENQVQELFRRDLPDMVIHLAGQPGVRLPISENYKYVRDNLVGFTNIATQSCIANVGSFLYASSSSVYGNTEFKDLSEKLFNLRPISFYGATKLSNELLANALANSSNTRFRGLRFFTVYGPWGRPDMAYLKLINAGLNNQRFELFGDGTKERDFTYISDVVTSVISLGNELMTRDSKFCDVVNIGGGIPVSMTSLIETIEKQLGIRIQINRNENAVGDVSNTKSDPSYLKSLIPTHPFVDLEMGIKQTIEWAKDMNEKNDFRNWLK